MDLAWNTKSVTLQDIIKNPSRPEIIKFEDPGSINVGQDVDMHRPVLLYSHRKRSKVCCKQLQWDERDGAYVSDGTLIEIPKDYPGWFQLVDRAGSSGQFYNTLGEVSTTSAKYLLTHTLLVGFRSSGSGKTLKLGEELKLYPGELLKIEGVVKKKWKTAHNETSTDSNKEPETKFLHVKDGKNQNLCLPLAHPGKFSPVAAKGVRMTHAVFQVASLMMNFHMPLTVRLAFGWPPVMKGKAFTAVLQLCEVYRPDTIVTYPLGSNLKTLVELPADIDANCVMANNYNDFEKSSDYTQALEFCKRKVFYFVSSMKVLDQHYKSSITNSSTGAVDFLHSCKLASPMDMKLFSPLNIYPVCKDQDPVYENWSLTFTDPQEIQDLHISMATAADDMGEFAADGIRRLSIRESARVDRRDSTVSHGGYSDTGYTDRKRRPNDLRALQEEATRAREAKC